jgi:D-aminoacyl-tRNA deacylase
VGDAITGEISMGLLVLLGVGRDDGDADAGYLAEKIVKLRVFDDRNGRMNLNVQSVGGAVLVVSQFTVYGDCRKGARPNYDRAAPPDVAQRLYESFISNLRAAGLHVETGIFKASMRVTLVNDGPVTLIIDSDRVKE